MPMSFAPVMPKSAWRASPMPLTAQPEHRDLDRVLVGFQAPLDLDDDAVHVELQPPAGRAGDQVGAALAQLQRLEDLPGDLDLLLGVEGRQRDADRVADPVGEQRAEPDGGLQRARPLRAGLGHAEVQRVGDPLGEHPVGGDRVRHRGRLHRDLEVREVQALHQLRPSRSPPSRAPRPGCRTRAGAGAWAASRS